MVFVVLVVCLAFYVSLFFLVVAWFFVYVTAVSALVVFVKVMFFVVFSFSFFEYKQTFFAVCFCDFSVYMSFIVYFFVLILYFLAFCVLMWFCVSTFFAYVAFIVVFCINFLFVACLKYSPAITACAYAFACSYHAYVFSAFGFPFPISGFLVPCVVLTLGCFCFGVPRGFGDIFPFWSGVVFGWGWFFYRIWYFAVVVIFPACFGWGYFSFGFSASFC